MSGTPIPPPQPGYFGTLREYVTGPARPIFVNAAFFIAGVAFIQSSFMEYLAPQAF